jgi:hypothetical protein
MLGIGVVPLTLTSSVHLSSDCTVRKDSRRDQGYRAHLHETTRFQGSVRSYRLFGLITSLGMLVVDRLRPVNVYRQH